MEKFKDKTILVTGGAGFIGSHLVHRLIKEGALVHLLVRSSTNKQRIKDIVDLVTIHEIDLTETEKLNQLLTRIKPNGVFHLAGESQTFWNIPKTEDLVAMNILATVNLMDAMSELDYDFFVNTGTFTEVGAKSEPLKEDHILEPTEFYSISRTVATLYAKALGQTKEKSIVTVRVFTPYGPFVQKGKFPYEVISKSLVDEEIIVSDPTVTRDFIYIDDLVNIYIQAAIHVKRNKGEIFNGGSGISTTLGDFVKIVLEYTGSKSEISKPQKIASYDKGTWQADVSKTSKILSWEAKTTLEDGIKKTVDWFSVNKNYWKNN